jgi:hypothetical protein
MLNSVAFQALALLISLPGLGSFHGFHVHRTKSAAVADTIPPRWKPASRLALENQFVFASLPVLGANSFGSKLKIQTDPRAVRVDFDADSGAVSSVVEMGDVRLGDDMRLPLGAYSQDLARRSFQRQWAERSRQNINTLGNLTPSTGTRPGITFSIPSPLPKRVQSWLGPGGPAINVSGSENIRISGQSNWSNQIQLGQKKSLFPSLDMQQDLNVRLEGQLSDRIRVNLLQNSAVQIPLANRIAINYKGGEDDLVQELDLGNTNLSLPGTQYVSYSGKNEGLFGMKAATRLGPLDFTVLASKQEGRSERASYGGGASRQTQTLRDLEYIHDVYYFLYDPNSTDTTWDIPDESIRIYKDDNNHYNDVNTAQGRALINPADSTIVDSPSDSTLLGRGPVQVHMLFRQLLPGADDGYEILHDVYGPYHKVIRLKQPLTSDQRLACSYLERPAGTNGAYQRVGEDVIVGVDRVWTLKLLRAPYQVFTPDSTGNFDPGLALAPVRDLELKNFYPLAGQRIDPTSMKIVIRNGVTQPPITNLIRPGQSVAVPYLEALGLDNLDESTGTPVRNHDAKFDQSLLNPDTRPFVDFINGVLFFYDLRPFAPRLGPSGKRFEQILSGQLNRRDSLRADQGDQNPAVYDKYLIQRDTDTKYYIDVEFSAARGSGEITLGRSNIVEGSEVVTRNGQPLVRDRDYSIDYDLGRVTLKTQLGPADQINVDYAYAPLFQQAGRTLIGSAFSLSGLNRSVGGAFMYESRGAQDLRPRLGEEPSRSLIGDLNTKWSFKPDWITRMVDALPGVRTTAPSEFNIETEVGASFPNPNTRNEVFIDDMEGVRDAVSLTMTADRWHWSSVPSVFDAAGNVRSLLDIGGYRNAEIHWYTPYAVVKERDLKPGLTDAQGGQNTHQVLAISVPREPTVPPRAVGDKLWSGLTYSLDQSGLDLTKAQFIELWVNDFKDARLRAGAKLRIDLGSVSEDQMRAPDDPPNGILDTEDKEPRDNQLVVDEDTGIDGLPDGAETRQLDLTTASPSDPSGDDFKEPIVDENGHKYREEDPRRYRFTNGTEGNKSVFPYPNTEDLNLDKDLAPAGNYFEYTVDFCETCSPYLAADVGNGWRRYRIPIADSSRVKFGAPNLALVQHVRIWIDGEEPNEPPDGAENQLPLVMLGGLDIVGSRWRATDLTPDRVHEGTTVTLNSVNSVDNADIYTPPFDPGETRSGSQGYTRRDQSLALEFTHLLPGGELEAYKTFSVDEDYSRYGKLDWYSVGFRVENAHTGLRDSLQYFVRFASDERGTSYYEYRAPLPSNGSVARVDQSDWSSVNLDLTRLSSLKLLTTTVLRDTTLNDPQDPRITLSIRGRPSFTRLRRVSVGVVADSTRPDTLNGQFWFNELRATDVAKDRGHAERVQLNGRMSNLLGYNLSWDGRSADFLSVGEARGGGNSVSNFSFGSQIDLHRFFEGTGIVLPVSFAFGQNTSKPRFNAGDDIVRTGAQADASESFGDSRSWQVNYSRTWSERSNRLLYYTLGGITANFRDFNSHNRNPNQVDQSRRRSGSVNYQIAPRMLLAIPLPWSRSHFRPLPERLWWNYRRDDSETITDSRNFDTGAILNHSDVIGRQGSIGFGADTRPFEFIHHHIEGLRNLSLPAEAQDKTHFGFLHFGRVVRWGQSLDAHYAMNKGPWLRPNFQWNSRFDQGNGPELSRDLSIRDIGNGQDLTMSWGLPFDGLAVRPAARVAAPTDSGKPLGPARLPLWRDLLSRLGSVSTDGSVRWNSHYSRMTGTPGALYLLGLSGRPELGSQSIQTAANSQTTNGFEWRGAARTRIVLAFGASMQTSAELTSQMTSQNLVETRHETYHYPDLQIDYGNVPSALGLNKLFNDPRLSTSFSSNRGSDYNNSLKTGSTISKEWRPLLGLRGDLKNGTHVDLSIERRSTVREQFQLGTSRAIDNNTDVNFGMNRSYTQGQRVKFLGKETTVKSSINLGVSASYNRQSGGTEQNGQVRFPTQSDRLSLNTTGSYGFSSNVTGSAQLGFQQNRDIQRDIVRRSLRVEVSAAFTF